MNDLGTLNYFLVIEVHRDKNGLFHSQQKHATDILQRTDIITARARPTPLSLKHHLNDSTGPPVKALNIAAWLEPCSI